MPRKNDQEANFGQLTEGAIRVLDESGLAGLTWQAVARASGMSMSAVRHRCDLRHDRLVRFVVIALCRAARARVQKEYGIWSAAGSPLDHALARLPRSEADRRGVRVAAMLAADPSLPEDSARILAQPQADHQAWCRNAMAGDTAAALVLEMVTVGLESAMARREGPLERTVAEEVLRRLLAADGTAGRHANLSPTATALA